MQIIPLGLVTIAAFGTPQQLTSDAVLLAFKVRTIIVQPSDANTGKFYFGKNATYTGQSGTVTVTFNASTGAGMIKTFLTPATTGLNDWFMLPVGEGPSNLYVVGEFMVDSSVASQKAHVNLVVH